MTNEPFELLEHALRDVASQRQNLTEMIARLHLHNTPETNRRNLTPRGSCVERRHGERRLPQRAVAGRRETPDRRLPPHKRIAEWQSELDRVIERGVQLQQLKQNFLTQSSLLID